MYVRYVHRVEKYVNSTLYVNRVKSKTHTYLTMAEPLAPPAAWLWCINSCPPPGNLFAMGSLRALSKGFVKFRRPATKIIYLDNRMIYFSFLHPPPSLIVPKRLNHTPLSHPTGRTSSRILPLSWARVFGWLLCMFNSSGAI